MKNLAYVLVLAALIGGCSKKITKKGGETGKPNVTSKEAPKNPPNVGNPPTRQYVGVLEFSEAFNYAIWNEGIDAWWPGGNCAQLVKVGDRPMIELGKEPCPEGEALQPEANIVQRLDYTENQRIDELHSNYGIFRQDSVDQPTLGSLKKFLDAANTKVVYELEDLCTSEATKAVCSLHIDDWGKIEHLHIGTEE